MGCRIKTRKQIKILICNVVVLLPSLLFVTTYSRSLQRDTGVSNLLHVALGEGSWLRLALMHACVLQEALRKLPGEAKKQAGNVEGTGKKLSRVREIMQTNAVVSSRSAREMLQSCVIPRLLMSPEDAIFCATFFLRMHDLDMPGFSTCYAINEVCCRRLGLSDPRIRTPPAHHLVVQKILRLSDTRIRSPPAQYPVVHIHEPRQNCNESYISL